MNNIESWLRLALCPGLGARTGQRLIAEFGSLEAILGANVDQLDIALGARGRALHALIHNSETEAQVAQQLDCLKATRGGERFMLGLDDPRYPESLRTMHDPPLVLWAEGDLNLLEQPSIAIVGSRNATRQGEENAKAFASALAHSGYCVVSGLALGIDSAAHLGALGVQGKTIAVFGCGVDITYPRRNRRLHEDIASNGLVISEQPFGAGPRAGTFPMRNRIIAGLSQACLVIEAAAQSGSLITAQCALEQGKDVLALPGSIHLAQSKGCHALIKQGAALVESVDDVLAAMPLRLERKVEKSIAPPSSEHPLLHRIGFDPVRLDDITETAEEVASLTAELLGLELANRVERLPDGRYLRIS